MKFRRRPYNRDENLIDMTPFIDLVFTLLIFFMVSTTFSREAEMRIRLPEASAAQAPDRDNMIVLNIDAQGHYYINGKALINEQAETLKRALSKEAKEAKVPLIISADGNTPHQAVITAMDAARQVGLVNLSFATQQQSSSTQPASPK